MHPGGDGTPEPVKTHLFDDDGNIVEATVDLLTEKDATKLQEWLDVAKESNVKIEYPDLWTMPLGELRQRAEHGHFHIKVEAEGQIQGLATFDNKESFLNAAAVYVGHMEAAPWNRHLLGRKKLGRVGYAVMEAAARHSLKLGYGGMIVLVAETAELVGYYEKMGFVLLVEEHRVMVLSPESASKFLKKREK